MGRLRVIAERCGTKADLDAASMDDLKKICQQYFDKWYSLEGEMFFLQREVILRDLQINELTISASDMKGKFIKPTLKKVSKYENKFAKLQEKAAKFAFANQLRLRTSRLKRHKCIPLAFKSLSFGCFKPFVHPTFEVW